jgi:Raf kinase inhibitor-like YbhB/YbcL family protein
MKASKGRRLPEGAGNERSRELLVGRNDFGHHRCDGPKPPKGHGVHHYHFRIAALDAERIDLPPDQNAADLWKAVKPHILAEAETIGTYQR